MTDDRPTLMVTGRLPHAVLARAERAYNLRMPGQLGVRDWICNSAAGADAILFIPGQPFDAALIAGLPQSVRVLGTFSVGTDHIDLGAARARGLAVVNTPGVLSGATAEFTMALILAAGRRIGEGERMVREGRWSGLSTTGLLGQDISGKRLGIFGMGRIGQCLARIAAGGFGMEVHYRNRTRLVPEAEQGTRFHASDASFLAASEVLCLMAPASAETFHWLDSARLAQLPRGAIVVNTGRGALIKDAALVAALRSGQVAAAALDVFPEEPKVPEDYLSMQNVVLTPHIATATIETRNAMGFAVLDGIDAVLEGTTPVNRVV